MKRGWLIADGRWQRAGRKGRAARRVVVAMAGVLVAACAKKSDAPPKPPVVTTEFDGEAALKYAGA